VSDIAVDQILQIFLPARDRLRIDVAALGELGEIGQ